MLEYGYAMCMGALYMGSVFVRMEHGICMYIYSIELYCV